MMPPLSKAKLSSFRSLLRKKFRESENRFLIEGWHLLDEALKANATIRTLIVDEARALSRDDLLIKKAAQDRAEECFSATATQLQSLAGTVTSQGVMAAIDRIGCDFEELDDRLSSRSQAFVVFLDGVSDPGNCGSIIRSCDWFGVDGVVMGCDCPELENGKLVRATMGSLFHLPIVRVQGIEDSLSRLKKRGFQVVASSLNESTSMSEHEWANRTVLVIGNEARGVSQSVVDNSDTILRIPKFGMAESLNAAMAASIMLSHWRCGSLSKRQQREG